VEFIYLASSAAFPDLMAIEIPAGILACSCAVNPRLVIMIAGIIIHLISFISSVCFLTTVRLFPMQIYTILSTVEILDPQSA